MKKRICATFLALCLVMSLLPANALAAEPGEEEPQAAVCTCETLCTKGTVNDQCSVCMADIAACAGEAPQPERPYVPARPCAQRVQSMSSAPHA